MNCSVWVHWRIWSTSLRRQVSLKAWRYSLFSFLSMGTWPLEFVSPIWNTLLPNYKVPVESLSKLGYVMYVLSTCSWAVTSSQLYHQALSQSRDTEGYFNIFNRMKQSKTRPTQSIHCPPHISPPYPQGAWIWWTLGPFRWMQAAG